MNRILGGSPRKLLAVCLFNLLVVLGCQQVRFVSPYDEVVDRGTSALHTKIAAFVGRMVTLAGKPEGTYAANESTYPELRAEVSTLLLRATSAPKNDVTRRQFDELQANLERLRQLHQLGADRGLRKAVADPALAAIDVNCGAIIKLELAKRRGED